jgi:hypothetical protein
MVRTTMAAAAPFPGSMPDDAVVAVNSMQWSFLFMSRRFAQIRLAWHASGTWDPTGGPDGTGIGGSNGATMRFMPESNHSENPGLDVSGIDCCGDACCGNLPCRYIRCNS